MTTTVVQLAVGFPYREDPAHEYRVVKEISVRKFSMRDKIEVYGLAKKDPLTASCEFMSRVVVEPKLTRKQAEKISTSDRDIIMAQSYMFTRGPTARWAANCNNRMCGFAGEITVDLSEFEITYDTDGFYHLVGDEMHYTIQIDGVGDVVLKAITFVEQKKVSKIVKSGNELAGVYSLYAACLVKWGEDEGSGSKGTFTVDFLYDLTEDGDHTLIDQLEAKVDKADFGFPRSHIFECTSCGRESQFMIDMMSFFFQNPLMEEGA